MALLASTNYDPGTAVTVPSGNTALLAMTAIDTTNLRLTFTAPSNGKVMVRIRCNVHGSATNSVYLLGVLDGSTIIARQSPLGGLLAGETSTTNFTTQEALFTVTGLTPSSSYTWDVARGVEISSSGSKIKYGGPSNNTANDSFGGFIFEIWEAPNLLASVLYDPSTAVSCATSSVIAMTALDTTNLRHTFTVPSSGNVLVRLRGVIHGANQCPQILLGIKDGSTVVAKQAGIGSIKTALLATTQLAVEAEFCVTGLTPASSLTWDASYSVETLIASTGLKYGGPNDTTTNNAFGGFLYEIWEI